MLCEYPFQRRETLESVTIGGPGVALLEVVGKVVAKVLYTREVTPAG